MADKRLDVTQLDFDTIKSNLKIFLKNQDTFTDYDFEGSGINILLDTLAYNTHYLAFNANMLANEMFLDSSSLRSSVVSHAKTLGYEPTSVVSPTATVNITLNNVSSDTYTMPIGTKFNATVDGQSYTFVTTSEYTSSKSGTTVTFNGVLLYEGSYISTRYVVNTADVEQRFIIPNSNVDTRTIGVSVQNSSTDSLQTAWTKATDITQLTQSSTTYFSQEVENGKFELVFGDGVVSKSLLNGNIVIISYVVSNKDASNGASGFTNAASIQGETDVTVTTVSKASGGGERETINSIKLLAPLDYASQGRCVTANDYKVYAKKLYPSAQTIQVFGGEDGSFDSSLGVVSTPEYGRVFISIKSVSGNNLTSSEKSNLIKSLKQYNVASITPVIVDPEVTFIILQSVFKYNSNKTTKSKDTLKSEVISKLTSFGNSDLKEFNAPLRHSHVIKLVDDSDTSITSNSINVTLAKYVEPTVSKTVSYTIAFNNKLYNPHLGHNKDGGGIISSTGFKITGNTSDIFYFDDDGSGNIRRFYLVGSTRTYVDNVSGVVDYLTGIITINGINISSVNTVDGLASLKFRITALPDSKDIVPLRNQLLELDMVNTTVIAEVDTIEVSNQGGTSSYSATPHNPIASSY